MVRRIYLQIAILAGGKATRLYPTTKTISKSMIKICRKPFFTYQIELLKKNNINNIVMCVGTFSEQIVNYFGDGKKFGVSIKYSVEKPNNLLGTAGALKNAQEYLDDTFFVTYGDSYLPIDFSIISDTFKKSGKLALMTVYKNNNNFDTSNVAINANLVTIYNKSAKDKNLEYIDYGLLILKKQVLDIIPSHKFVNLDFLINKLIEKTELLAYEIKERFYEIGSIDGIKDFENYIKSRQ